MSLWKLLISLMLGVVLSLGFAACGNDDDDSSNDDDVANDDDMTDPCDLCTGDQVCENDVCVDPPANDDDDDDMDPVNAPDLVGKTFAFMCILDGTVSQPPGLGPVLKGLVQCSDIPPIALTILAVDGDVVELVGASLTADAKYDPAESVVLAMPPADFSGNPVLELTAEGEIEIEIEGIILRIKDLEITGVVLADFSAVTDGTFGGAIDPAPLADVLGSDPCGLIPGICGPDGFISLFVEDLEAVQVDTQIPPAE